jgi:hypothetical protein
MVNRLSGGNRLVEWTEDKAKQELSDAGSIFEGKAFKDPERLTARLLSAMDYLINYHMYYHKAIR